MAANTNVYTGADAVLTLAVDQPDTVKGGLGKTLIENFEVATVGRASDVAIYVTNDLRAFHEIGKRLPATVQEGNINISGKIGRAYINGALLSLLLGDYAQPTNGKDPLPQPKFNLLMTLTDSNNPGTNSVLTLNHVKFENWSFLTPENDFVMESVTFKATSITVADTKA